MVRTVSRGILSRGILARVAVLLGAALLSGAAWANWQVVATTSSMGMLARTIGGEAVSVTVLAPPDRDAHFLQARPSMMAALRRADLLVAVGAELEIGWLPAALQGASNPRLNPGSPGYFAAADQVSLLGVSGQTDRSQGDIHPHGNPHLNLDPQRMAQVGQALAERLAVLDPAGATGYRARAAHLAELVAAREQGWRTQVATVPGVLPYHRDLDYLLHFLAVPIHGYVEVVAGVPPTARQLAALTERMAGQRGILLRTTHQPAAALDYLARETGWPQQALPLEPPVNASAEDWLALLQQWVDAITHPHE